MSAVAGGLLYGMLDFVGSAATVGLAVPALRKGGRFVVSGLFGGATSGALGTLASDRSNSAPLGDVSFDLGTGAIAPRHSHTPSPRASTAKIHLRKVVTSLRW